MDNSKSSQKIEIGDIVQLKSGGPNMTVIKVQDGKVQCQWFSGEYHDKVESYFFPPDSLEKK